jgi:hypothetical protein
MIRNQEEYDVAVISLKGNVESETTKLDNAIDDAKTLVQGSNYKSVAVYKLVRVCLLGM